MSVEQMFEEINEFITEDFETENPKFQLYIAVGVGSGQEARGQPSTLYVPVLDSIHTIGPPKNTVILAFDSDFNNIQNMSYACKTATDYFKNELDLPIAIDFFTDLDHYINKPVTQVRVATIMVPDFSQNYYDVNKEKEANYIEHRLSGSGVQIMVYFLPMGLPTDYFRDIVDLTGKQWDEWTRIEHVKKYTNVFEYANTCVPKQPIYLELQKFMSKADSISIFNDAWYHRNARFYSNIYFEDMCELLNIALNSDKPIRILSSPTTGTPFRNTKYIELYNTKVSYGVHNLTKDSTLVKRGGKRTKRRVYRRRVTFRKPALRR